MRPEAEDWLDADATRLVRPYAVVGGRTAPANQLDVLSMVAATGSPAAGLGPDHAMALSVCARPVSIAEVAACIQLPAVIAKIIISDLMNCGAVTERSPGPPGPASRDILQQVLDGLQAL